MGRHTEWRRLAKKLRRKRIRQKLASERDDLLKKEQELREKSPRYQQWLAQQEATRLFEEQEERRIAQENERQWLQKEEESRRQWEELQRKLEHIKEERRKQEERIQQEWEREQKALKEAKERKEQDQKEKERQEELFREQIDEYVINGGCMPEDLFGYLETNPGRDKCPFFSKVGVCRFGDGCSRNHARPKVSNILLFPGFYSHITLNQTSESEYGSDSSLEYDDRETYIHYCEFFDDILPELQKCGCVVLLRVSCNKEPHLRGNVYVEYMSPRDAIRAYRTFQGRWYGGKQLNVEFCHIPSWRTAICGMSYRNRCPKGSSCNFLHLFRNPGRMFEDFITHKEERYTERNMETNGNAQNWRWSVTPERDFNNYNNDDKKRHKSPHEHRSYRSSKDNKHSSSKRRSRSRSPSYHRKERSSRERSKDNRSNDRHKERSIKRSR